jgi:integrase/transposase-like protein
MTNPPCLHCQSEKVIKNGFYFNNKGESKPNYLCKNCRKTFFTEYVLPPPESAEMDCPKCKSNNTLKSGQPLQRTYGEVQKCRCIDCETYFLKGLRKRLYLYNKGELRMSFWEHNIPEYYADVACPNCQEYQVLLTCEHQDKYLSRTVKRMLCLNCGQKFTGEGKPWTNQIKRKQDKKIEKQPFRIEDDLWDLRVLYPDIDEYSFQQIFLNFSNVGDRKFKRLVKKYLIERISQGLKSGTIIAELSTLRLLGNFLEKSQITSLKRLNREILAIYWGQERTGISAKTQAGEITVIRQFFAWLNRENIVSIPKTLLTVFDTPKFYQDDPDPLEDHVLEAIRNNIYLLPEPLQLQFMLGFWLGARPGELNKLSKNCLNLDPDGSIWWLKFERDKNNDENRLPITTDLVRLIQKQHHYISELFGEDYPYLFCHYQGVKTEDYPNYQNLTPLKRLPLSGSNRNSMVKAIRHLIKFCQIKDSNGEKASFTGAILRPTRATHLIRNGYSLEFIRIWLKHKSANTTYKHYVRYRPGEMLDVALVMANLDNQFYPYESNPETLRQQFQELRQNPQNHELDGLTTIGGVPLIGYCLFRDFCPRFGHCYGCGFHVASLDKLSLYQEQLDKLKAKETEVFNFGSAEMLGSYEDTIRRLEAIIKALESQDE